MLQLITETGYSFPSGHAMINGSIYLMLILLTFRYLKGLKRVSITFVFAFITVLIGYTRIYLGVHYFGDVVGGWLIGSSVSVLIFLLWNHFYNKKRI